METIEKIHILERELAQYESIWSIWRVHGHWSFNINQIPSNVKSHLPITDKYFSTFEQCVNYVFDLCIQEEVKTTYSLKSFLRGL